MSPDLLMDESNRRKEVTCLNVKKCSCVINLNTVVVQRPRAPVNKKAQFAETGNLIERVEFCQ
jgi:hypothetical protein